jgi:hypothetical protein
MLTVIAPAIVYISFSAYIDVAVSDAQVSLCTMLVRAFLRNVKMMHQCILNNGKCIQYKSK